MKKLILLLFAAFSALFFAACQETPEEVIAVKEDTVRMIEQAQNNGEDSLSIQEQVNAPKRFICDLTNESITVKADVPIYVPEADSAPTMTVKRGEFSQETITRLWDCFVGETPMFYEPQISTKDELEEMILLTQQRLDEEQDEKIRTEYEAYIDELKEQQKTAPQTREPVSADSTIVETGKKTAVNSTEVVADVYGVIAHDEQNTKHFYAAADIEPLPGITGYMPSGIYVSYQEKPFVFELLEQADNSAPDNLSRDYIDNVADDMPLPSVVGLSPKEARGQAEQLITELELPMEARRTTLTVYYEDIEKTKPVSYEYTIHFTRVAEGIPVAFSFGGGTPMEDEYMQSWDYETLQVTIQEDGFAYFEWRNPLETADKEADDCVLLPFSDIQTVFEKMIPITYADQADGYEQINLRLSEVRLEMTRIIKQDSPEYGLLIPTWNFYGVRERTHANGDTDTALDSLLLSVNAVDGTVIDLVKGY